MHANLSRSSTEVWLSSVNKLYLNHQCLPLQLREPALQFDQLHCPHALTADGPLVTVIMAVWNAAAVLDTAIASLLNQTHRNLELIVVDDASSDDSVRVVTGWAQRDPRVRLLQQPFNAGPYAARNLAMTQARGEFITVHDSDDWSHPQKLAIQVQALLDDDRLQAVQSAWVRASEALYFGGWDTPSSWHGWVHRNTSSLMMRRSVFETLGYWDEVRCSADVEYVDRIQAHYGPAALSVVLPQLPLAFGRIGEQTLTRRPETHLLTVLKGLRHDYQRAYSAWHAAATSAADLYLPRSPQKRPFAVPDTMLTRAERPADR